MKENYLGDSFDIVKKFLIQSLAPGAEWVAIPMFSHEFKSDDIQAFEEFLGVQVISKSVITKYNRIGYLTALDQYHYIFIDPDKGIRLKPTDSVEHISGEELVKLCREIPTRLLLVYDQSFDRGKKRDEEIEEKLSYFQKERIYRFMYKSHACFIVLSASEAVCQNAYDHLLNSGLPGRKLSSGIA